MQEFRGQGKQVVAGSKTPPTAIRKDDHVYRTNTSYGVADRDRGLMDLGCISWRQKAAQAGATRELE